MQQSVIIHCNRCGTSTVHDQSSSFVHLRNYFNGHFNGYQLNRVGTLYASSNVKWFEFYTRKNCIAVKCITYARFFIYAFYIRIRRPLEKINDFLKMVVRDDTVD